MAVRLPWRRTGGLYRRHRNAGVVQPKLSRRIESPEIGYVFICDHRVWHGGQRRPTLHRGARGEPCDPENDVRPVAAQRDIDDVSMPIGLDQSGYRIVVLDGDPELMYFGSSNLAMLAALPVIEPRS